MPIFDEDLPDELKKKLESEPWAFMANYWQHPESPRRNYDFKTSNGDKTLNYLLDEDSPLKADNWGNINVLLMARGCLKTTSVLGIINWGMYTYPSLDAFVTSPREQQVNKFVEKFKDKAKESGLSEFYDKNRLSHQKFQREVDDRIFTNNMYAVTSWGEADAMRGDHTHIGVIDEFQDVSEEAFSNVMEAIDRELENADYFPSIFVIGTPKMGNSFFEEIWEKSDKKTWDSDENEWVKQSESKEYKPLDADEDVEGFSVKGWHIDQYNSPLHSKEEIEMKRDMYSERRFKNEVLAEFHTPEDDLLSDEDVEECFDESIGFTNAPRQDDSVVTIGVDWGGGKDAKAAKTAVVVGEHIELEDDTVETITLDVDFFDENLSKQEELNRIENKIIKYNPDKVVVDEGYGSTRRESLQNGSEDIKSNEGYDSVTGCRFGNIKNKEDIKWDSTGEKRFFTVDKSYLIEKVVDEFKKQYITIPKADLSFGRGDANGNLLMNHLTAPYKDKVETPSGTKKLRIQSDRNDDVMDAFAYMLAGHRMIDTFGNQLTDIVSHDRF